MAYAPLKAPAKTNDSTPSIRATVHAKRHGPQRPQRALPARTPNLPPGELLLGSKRDRSETEADRVSAAVSRRLCAPRCAAGDASQSDLLPRLAAPVGADAVGAAIPAPAGLTHAVRHAQRLGGRPIEPGLRHSMEDAFAFDFSRVRIHAGAAAAELAQRARARAFTIDHDIFFNRGAFAPHTEGGRRLVAHELAHVTQRPAAVIRRFAEGGDSPSLMPPIAAGEVISRTEREDVLDGKRQLVSGMKMIRLGRDGQTFFIVPETAVFLHPRGEYELLPNSEWAARFDAAAQRRKDVLAVNRVVEAPERPTRLKPIALGDVIDREEYREWQRGNLGLPQGTVAKRIDAANSIYLVVPQMVVIFSNGDYKFKNSQAAIPWHMAFEMLRENVKNAAAARRIVSNFDNAMVITFITVASGLAGIGVGSLVSAAIKRTALSQFLGGVVGSAVDVGLSSGTITALDGGSIGDSFSSLRDGAMLGGAFGVVGGALSLAGGLFKARVPDGAGVPRVPSGGPSGMTGRGLVGKSAAFPSGDVSAELRRLYEKQLESWWFKAKLKTYAALTGKGKVDWDGLVNLVKSAQFREYGSAAEMRQSVGFAGIKDGQIHLGMSKFVRKLPILGNSSLQHELIHVYQEMTMRTLTREMEAKLLKGENFRLEMAAQFFGSPAVVITTPVVFAGIGVTIAITAKGVYLYATGGGSESEQ